MPYLSSRFEHPVVAKYFAHWGFKFLNVVKDLFSFLFNHPRYKILRYMKSTISAYIINTFVILEASFLPRSLSKRAPRKKRTLSTPSWSEVLDMPSIVVSANGPFSRPSHKPLLKVYYKSIQHRERSIFHGVERYWNGACWLKLTFSSSVVAHQIL